MSQPIHATKTTSKRIRKRELSVVLILKSRRIFGQRISAESEKNSLTKQSRLKRRPRFNFPQRAILLASLPVCNHFKFCNTKSTSSPDARRTLRYRHPIARSFESNIEAKPKNRSLFRLASRTPSKASLAAAPHLFIQIRFIYGSFLNDFCGGTDGSKSLKN